MSAILTIFRHSRPGGWLIISEIGGVWFAACFNWIDEGVPINQCFAPSNACLNPKRVLGDPSQVTHTSIIPLITYSIIYTVMSLILEERTFSSPKSHIHYNIMIILQSQNIWLILRIISLIGFDVKTLKSLNL